jgi:hypothetical protein
MMIKSRFGNCSGFVVPELSPEQFPDLFAEWRDRYQTKRDAEAAELPAKLAALWSERDELFTKRATAPESERDAITARIAAIAQELAELVAPPTC